MPTLTPVMMLVLGEDVWAVVRTTLVHDAQAILPEPDDEPTPEPDDEPEPDNEPDDEADDDPGTLYFGERVMDGPILLQPNSTPSRQAGRTSRARRGRFLCYEVNAPRLPRRCSDLLGRRTCVCLSPGKPLA